MLWVTYKNDAQAWVPIIMACMAAIGDPTMAPIHRAGVVTQWFDEHDTNVIHMSWPSQSPDLN